MTRLSTTVLTIALLLVNIAPARSFPVDFGPSFTTRTIAIDGGTVSVTAGGHGPVIVLLHGYAEDSRMWRQIAPQLAKRFTVVAPDLPGIGNSSVPNRIGIIEAAKQLHQAVRALGYRRVSVVGHDIGLMVAYAFAATYRAEVTRLALLEAFLPGVQGWDAIYDSPTRWHFRFFGPTPVALVTGRERIYFEYFWNDFAANPHRSLPDKERSMYASAYARSGRMAAGFSYCASWTETVTAFQELSKRKLSIPVLSIAGDHSMGDALGRQVQLVADGSDNIVAKDTGHWLLEENPAATSQALISFLERP